MLERGVKYISPQNMMCEIEKMMGIYPNIENLRDRND